MYTHNSPPLHRRTLLIASLLSVAAIISLATAGAARTGAQGAARERPTIVLVHGDWADGSSWTDVVKRLQGKGYNVVAPPNLLRGPGTDGAYLASYLRTIPGPIVLVAHSYGGFVATNAATGNANVKALVYIDAFVPDEGETLAALTARFGSCVGQDGLNPVPSDGQLDVYLRWEPNLTYPGFTECFANGVDEGRARVLAAVQRPAALVQYEIPSGPPAWKTIPAWSLIGTLDNVIPLPLQEEMASRAGARISRIKAGHLSLISHAGDVTKVILSAIDATT